MSNLYETLNTFRQNENAEVEIRTNSDNEGQEENVVCEMCPW